MQCSVCLSRWFCRTRIVRGRACLSLFALCHVFCNSCLLFSALFFGTGVCEKRCHPIITNSMRVEPFPLKVKVDACVRKAWRLQTWHLFSFSPCIRKLYASTLTLRGKGSTRIGFCIEGWHLFSQTPVPKNRVEKKKAAIAKT